MAVSVLVDPGFIVALLSRRDAHHRWAVLQARRHPPPWTTCDAALSEAFHLLGPPGGAPLGALLRRGALNSAFDLGNHLENVLRALEKYRDVPASLADACLLRMTETLACPILLTTDSDFRLYRRHGRQVVPVVMPDRSR
jgi:predicted nucleic acid-binding protein